ncbi:MAG: Nif3-like dinuclear metal center hexameric protein [Bacteroidota bacterium]
MIQAGEIIKTIEATAPLLYQESYDNSGWITGDPEGEVKGVLIALDCTMEVLEDAIHHGENLIITHHPLIFKPLKRLLKGDAVQEMLLKAIRHDIMIYATHTSMDNVYNGVNRELGKRLNLKGIRILRPQYDILRKLVVFVPDQHAEAVRKAMFAAGAGNIGNYDWCSYNTAGQGTFRAGEQTQAFVGAKHHLHFEQEQRVEVVLPLHIESAVVRAMKDAHPYEEVAYDLYALKNQHDRVGSGALGYFEQPMNGNDFLEFIKKQLGIPVLRYAGELPEKISVVAFAGGAGSFLIPDAIKAKADVFLTADLKYHDFFMGQDNILLIDAGHFETEQFTKHLIRDLLIKNFSNFAVRISQVNTNPVKYY